MVVHAIIFLLCAAAGTWAFLNSRRKALRIKGAASWPTAAGRIVSAKVTSYTYADSDGDSVTSFTPVVSYSFEHQGQARTGARIYVGDERSYSNEAAAQKVLAGFPVGGEVTVHIDPSDPDICALTVGGGTNISVAIIFWAIAVISLFIGSH